jgi:lipoprotein signal peptidase
MHGDIKIEVTSANAQFYSLYCSGAAYVRIQGMPTPLKKKLFLSFCVIIIFVGMELVIFTPTG